MKKKWGLYLSCIFAATIIFAPGVFLHFLNVDLFANNIIKLFSILIISFYLIGIVHLGVKLTPIYRQINFFENKIEDNKNFDNIDSVILNQKYLSDIYKEFKKTLRPIETGLDFEENPGEVKREYFATENAEEYFNEESLIYNNIFYKTVNFLPQILTGLGIFGTFLGIVRGVKDLGDNINTAEEMQNGIKTLLDGVELSFVSSLCGICFSIAFTIFMKFYIDMINAKNKKLVYIINSSLKKNTYKEGLKEIEIQLKHQTASVEKLATDLSAELGKKFDDTMQNNIQAMTKVITDVIHDFKIYFNNSLIENLTPTLQKIEILAKELGETQKQSTTQFMNETLLKIQEVIRVGTQNEIKMLNESLSASVNNINILMGDLSDGINNLKGIIVSQKDLIDHTNVSAENINNTSENISTLEKALDALISKMGSISENTSSSVDEISNIYKDMQEFSLKQGEITLKLSDMIEKSCILNKSQENYMDHFNNINESVSSNLEKFKDSISYMITDMSEYLNHFKRIKEHSSSIVDNLQSSYNDIIENFEYSSKVMNETINEVNSKIIQNTEVVTNKMVNLTDRMDQFSTDVMKVTEDFSDFVDAEKSTQVFWGSYQDTFEQLSQQITEGIENYTKLLKDSTYDVFKEYDHKIADAVKGLSSMVEAIQMVACDLLDGKSEDEE